MECKIDDIIAILMRIESKLDKLDKMMVDTERMSEHIDAVTPIVNAAKPVLSSVARMLECSPQVTYTKLQIEDELD